MKINSVTKEELLNVIEKKMGLK